MPSSSWSSLCFFFNDTATTEIYTLSLHDALPIYGCRRYEHELRAEAAQRDVRESVGDVQVGNPARDPILRRDRKSTRLNSSHGYISYAVFCLKKKKK